MMLKPPRTIRLTLLLRPDQYAGLRNVAERTFSRPSDYARRCLLQAITDAARAAEKPPPSDRRGGTE
jgi:hypothetical protein